MTVLQLLWNKFGSKEARFINMGEIGLLSGLPTTIETNNIVSITAS